MVTNPPIKKWRSGNISGVIWLNKKKVNGTELSFKTASLKRSWKQEGDVWREEIMNIRRQDIPKLMTILHEIQQELYSSEEKEGSENE